MWEGQATEEPSTQAYTLQPSPAQPSPGNQAISNPTLGKQLVPPRLALPLALPGAADHVRGEKTEGEREKEFRREREKSSGRQGIEGKDTKPGTS